MSTKAPKWNNSLDQQLFSLFENKKSVLPALNQKTSIPQSINISLVVNTLALHHFFEERHENITSAQD